MKKTHFLRASARMSLLAALPAMLLPSTAFAFAEFARGELLFRNELSVEYDSNIGGSGRETSDVIFGYAPTLLFLRQAGLYHISADAGMAFTRFEDNSQFHSNDFRSNLSLSGPHRPDQLNTVTGRVGYNEYNRADEDIADRLKTRVFDASLSSRIALTGKTGWRASGDYAQRRVTRDGLSGTRSFSVGNELVYLYSPKLDVGAGYRYREITFRGAEGTVKGHAYFLSATGDLSPKVIGRAAVGMQKERRQVPGATNRNTDALYYQLSLNWAATEKSTLVVSGQADIDATAARQGVRTTQLGADWRQRIDDQWSTSVGAAVGQSRYAGGGAVAERTDDFWTLRGALDYGFLRNGSAGLFLSYNERSSAFSLYDYSRFRAGLNLTITF